MIFPQLFFPDMAAVIPVLAFAVGFLFRPLGSAVFGSLGDRFGRRRTLVMTLYVTGISTVIIGLLPTHEVMGIWATVILIMARLTQTAAVGGEWAAASVLLTEHHTDQRRRGFIASFVSSSFAMASLLALAVFMAVMSFGEEFFTAGGWRIPFLLSGVLLVIGVYIRHRVMETPEFTAISHRQATSAAPLRELLRDHGKRVLYTALAISLTPTWVYGVMVFGAGYMLQTGVITRSELTTTQFLAWWVIAAALVISGWLSDRFNRWDIMAFGAVASLILTIPVFQWITQGQAMWAMLSLVLLIAPAMAVAPSVFADSFPVRVRQTGSGVAYNLGLVISGLITVLCQQIMDRTQNIETVMAVFLALTVTSLMFTWRLRRETKQ